jgi:hypothetical protein
MNAYPKLLIHVWIMARQWLQKFIVMARTFFFLFFLTHFSMAGKIVLIVEKEKESGKK